MFQKGNLATIQRGNLVNFYQYCKKNNKPFGHLDNTFLLTRERYLSKDTFILKSITLTNLTNMVLKLLNFVTPVMDTAQTLTFTLAKLTTLFQSTGKPMT